MPKSSFTCSSPYASVLQCLLCISPLNLLFRYVPSSGQESFFFFLFVWSAGIGMEGLFWPVGARGNLEYILLHYSESVPLVLLKKDVKGG